MAQAATLGLAGGSASADRNSLAGVSARARGLCANGAPRERGRHAGAAPRHRRAPRSSATARPDVLAYPTDRAAYGRLCRLLTLGKSRAPKGSCEIRLDDLIERAEGLQLIAIPDLARPDEHLAFPASA